jgi:hypothetical protein
MFLIFSKSSTNEDYEHKNCLKLFISFLIILKKCLKDNCLKQKGKEKIM